MGTGVKKYDATFWCVFDRRAHAVEVEALCFGGEIGVGLYGQLDIGENLVVIGPCWGREVDGLV